MTSPQQPTTPTPVALSSPAKIVLKALSERDRMVLREGLRSLLPTVGSKATAKKPSAAEVQALLDALPEK